MDPETRKVFQIQYYTDVEKYNKVFAQYLKDLKKNKKKHLKIENITSYRELLWKVCKIFAALYVFNPSLVS